MSILEFLSRFGSRPSSHSPPLFVHLSRPVWRRNGRCISLCYRNSRTVKLLCSMSASDVKMKLPGYFQMTVIWKSLIVLGGVPEHGKTPAVLLPQRKIIAEEKFLSLKASFIKKRNWSIAQGGERYGAENAQNVFNTFYGFLVDIICKGAYKMSQRTSWLL